MKNPFNPSHEVLATRHLEDAQHGLLNAHLRVEHAKAAVAQARAEVLMYEERIERLSK